ncbi:hypothetical protein ALC57_01935, partial [Trachymyrmex cornetzi]
GSVRYPTLSDIARDIWRWCETRNIYLFASYIASADNTIADRESRVTNLNTEWSLSTRAFNLLEKGFGPFDIDFFASAINTKNELYVSWLPDPGSWAIDAFTLSWTSFNFYAFPPFILIPKVLRKIVDERATGVLLVPWWPSQPWFPLFVHLLISEPLILPPSHSLLSSPLRKPHPEWMNLSLAAGRLSGDLSNPRRHHQWRWTLS